MAVVVAWVLVEEVVEVVLETKAEAGALLTLTMPWELIILRLPWELPMQ